jgi:hypothetical protein
MALMKIPKVSMTVSRVVLVTSMMYLMVVGLRPKAWI